MPLSLTDFYNLPIADYVNRKVISLDEKDSVQKAIELLSLNNIGALIVLYEGGKFGILSERDIIREYAMELYDFYEESVGDIMTVSPITVEIDSKLGEAFGLMDKHHIRHLPVMKNGKVIGLLSLRDLARAVATYLPKKIPAPKSEFKSAAKKKSNKTKKSKS